MIEFAFSTQAFKLQSPALVLSIDVESWEEANIDCQIQSNPALIRQVDKVLGLLAKFDAKATFFILGKVAETFPGVLKNIVSAGHEIGCHSYFHKPIYRQTPKEFNTDLLRARQALESVSGMEILGFRAPYFSITGKSLWALPILIEAGFAYDSSLVPVSAPNYGFANGREGFYRLSFPDGSSLLEAPPATIRVFGFKVPLGGGYFKMFSNQPFIKKLAHHHRQNQPAVFYFHPHELEELPPRGELKSVPYWVYWKENMGRRKMPGKLEFLLSSFPFTSFKQALKL
ncbi:MAG TPA: polysaccharide deacetylase family protein [candidate division Zixibacteria bacterium]|nr:polysaccharide deacetylase family protein [candidate division Zixibacteria bacterium]